MMRNKGTITDEQQLIDLMGMRFELIWRPQDQHYVLRKMKKGLLLYCYNVSHSLMQRLQDEGKLYVKEKTKAYYIFAQGAAGGGDTPDPVGGVANGGSTDIGL